MRDKKDKHLPERYLDKYTVRYPNGLIAIKCTNVTEQQLIMLGALIKEAHVSDANAAPGHLFTASVKKVKEILGLEAMHTHDLWKLHLVPLTKIHIEYNILNKDKKWGPLDPSKPMVKGAGCVLAGVELDESGEYLSFTFNSLLSARILNPYPCDYSYTPIHLLKTLKLTKKKYATRLYSNLKSYAAFKCGNPPVMSIDMFKTLIGMEDEYPNFADFRTKVIDECVKEINANSDIKCEYKLNKGGYRNLKYVSIEWKVSMKPEVLDVSPTEQPKQIPDAPIKQPRIDIEYEDPNPITFDEPDIDLPVVEVTSEVYDTSITLEQALEYIHQNSLIDVDLGVIKSWLNKTERFAHLRDSLPDEYRLSPEEHLEDLD